MKGCAEVSLNLLSPGEAVELLLRAGEVDDADEAATAAAAEIAALCGFLPLYLGICGTVCKVRGSLQHSERGLWFLRCTERGLWFQVA